MPPTLESVFDETLRTARSAQWPVHRLHFTALHEAFSALLRPDDEELRIRFDTLSAAVPAQDPEGYLAELELLAAALRARGVPDCQVAERIATLDLRGLQPPEPIVRIFDALERAPREPLRAILPHEPVPLYNLLRERGFTCSGEARPDGAFEVLIERC